jgi:membrane protein implicated in regulation of membrane protease activity
VNGLSHPWSRGAGVLLTALVVFFWESRSPAPLHSLILPLLLAGAAWLMTRSVMAVAFATFTLAAINTELAADHWIPSLAYPTIAFSALLICVRILAQRFRERIAATHEQRWAQRRRRQATQAGTNDSEHRHR